MSAATEFPPEPEPEPAPQPYSILPDVLAFSALILAQLLGLYWAYALGYLQ
jgi:hypothetical protein